jgi:tetratricopeptide (TPR) repeat protein
VDEGRLASADRAYAAGDWRSAAREYLAAVHGAEPEGSGRAYHMAGNSLMKLRRYGDASTVYGHALKDASYDKRAVVLTNLGGALSADARYSDAVSAYEAALAESDNESPYKAQQGLAGALFDMGRYEDACQAYREASWAPGNPDPGKALNNLGLCFMATGKPEDAVEAYKGAVNVDGYVAKGRASANLGLAYAAMGFHDEAVRAFEAARDTFSYPLTGVALSAYEASKASVSPQVAPEIVEGWSTGEIGPAEAGAPSAVEPTVPSLTATATTGARDDDQAFFTRTEEDMRTAGREMAKAERRERRSGKGLAVRIGAAALVVVLLLGGLGLAWYMGVGYPSQTTTVEGMIDAYRAGSDVASYWVAVPSTDVKQEMRKLPARFESFSVDTVEAGPVSASAKVTVRLQKDATLSYTVSLVREGVGWKVNGIQNDWRSTGS